MKNFALMVVLMLLVTACGGGTQPATEAVTEQTTEATAVEGVGTKEVTEAETEISSPTSIIGQKIETDDYVIVVNGTEVIEGQYDDFGDILALDITFTNKSDQPTSPWMALVFKAEQETETTVELLNGANGLFKEDYNPEKVKMGDTSIKPGATVDAIFGYELLYPGEPVYIRSFTGDDYEFMIETNN